MAKPNGHEKKIAEMQEKGASVGADDGYLWVVSTKDRLMGGGDRETLSEKVEDKRIKVGVFQTATAKVSVSKGLTINLGNFESARVTVGLDLPCYVEETKEIEEVVNKMVEDRIQAEVLEIRGKDIRPGYEEKRQG